MTSEARFIFNVATLVLLLGVLIATLTLAWLKGRPAERYGSTIYAISFFGSMALQVVTGQSLPIVPELFLDTLVAMGFLVLAIAYNNLWLGGAMMIKGVQLAMHATHLTDQADPKFLGLNMYVVGLDLVSLMILMTMLGGVLASMKARRAGALRSPNAPGAGGVQAA